LKIDKKAINAIVGVKKNNADRNSCGLPKVITDAIATTGNQVGTAAELPNPTKVP
jgi:hypothetical protein